MAKEVSVVSSWTLFGKWKYHVHTWCDICMALHAFAKWPSCRRQETASFRPKHILPKCRCQFRGDPKHALRKLQWIDWRQNSQMNSRRNNSPNDWSTKGLWLHSQRHFIPIFTHDSVHVGLALQRVHMPYCSRPQRLTVPLAELTVPRNHPTWTLGQTRGIAGQGGE